MSRTLLCLLPSLLALAAPGCGPDPPDPGRQAEFERHRERCPMGEINHMSRCKVGYERSED
jgi:hypothetical protein